MLQFSGYDKSHGNRGKIKDDLEQEANPAQMNGVNEPQNSDSLFGISEHQVRSPTTRPFTLSQARLQTASSIPHTGLCSNAHCCLEPQKGWTFFYHDREELC